jgi:hypothetical protein
MMKTRSKTLYQVDIDFDEASKAWMSNKKSIGNGHYKYICPKEKSNGTICGKSCYKENSHCWSHRMYKCSEEKKEK